MSLARRLAEHFVLPAGAQWSADPEARPAADRPAVRTAEHAASRTSAAPAVAVLAAAPDATALGAAIGMALAQRHGAPVAVVCFWNPDPAPRPAWRAPALPAARRVAAGLSARGHDAYASGRLVVVRLAGPPADAAIAARRALVAAGAVPAVLALGGPRAAAFDGLLTDQDLVVVATRGDSDPLVARLAVARLSGVVPACVCELPAATAARALAAAGVVLLPAARRALTTPIAELS